MLRTIWRVLSRKVSAGFQSPFSTPSTKPRPPPDRRPMKARRVVAKDVIDQGAVEKGPPEGGGDGAGRRHQARAVPAPFRPRSPIAPEGRWAGPRSERAPQAPELQLSPPARATRRRTDASAVTNRPRATASAIEIRSGISSSSKTSCRVVDCCSAISAGRAA
jgi:hypothetical protein